MPKQFRMLENGRTVLETCVETFESVDAIDDIYLVSHPNYLSTVYQLVLSNGWQKVRAVLEGGEQRWESSWKAISHFKDAAPDTNILLHDCARPFVSERILTDVCQALTTSEAVTVAVPVTDTLYRVSDGQLLDIPPRTDYLRAQTPQGFRLAVIREAYERFIADEVHTATDDIGVLRQYRPDVAIRIVAGEEQNRKLTFSSDF